MKPPNGARWAGVAAIVGGLMAILLTPPFATAMYLAYPENPLPFWFDAAQPRLEPLVTGASPGVVYETYGRIFNLVYVLFLPAAYVLHQLHVGSATPLERRGYRVMTMGLGLTIVGVAGDYWGNGIGFILEVPGLLILGVGMSIYGVALRRSGVMPTPCAWMFVLCGPGLVGFTVLVGHIPSGPTFPLALTWLAAGAALTRKRRRPLNAAA